VNGFETLPEFVQKVSIDGNSVIVEFIICFYSDNSRGVVVMVVVVGVVIVVVVVIVV